MHELAFPNLQTVPLTTTFVILFRISELTPITPHSSTEPPSASATKSPNKSEHGTAAPLRVVSFMVFPPLFVFAGLALGLRSRVL